ncbi:MAG: tRNA pseudouridine(38-40) synthase TruA [Desulfobulbaceae bacterium]|nr:tRNA pseudouridine(38-40) synthase TruA [Desulfobulbaceae bacterium]
MERVIRLLLAYDGTAYCGWQRQRQGEATIQAALETALQRICGHPLTVHGAGRTDAGVHALAMVAHFRTHVPHPLTAFSKGLNSLLAPDIRILGAQETNADFHSRFSACAKIYRYDFYTEEVMPPGLRLYMGHLPGAFNPQPARQVLAQLVGTHDFSSFERAGSRNLQATGGRGAVRTLMQTSCEPIPYIQNGWSIRLQGDGFLRQMVRIIAGTVIEIGQGKRPATGITDILAARDRKAAGLTAPACGLFLEQVIYPPE